MWSFLFSIFVVSAFFSSALDISPKDPSILFTTKDLDNSFFWRKLLPTLWLFLKFLEAFLWPIKKVQKLLKALSPERLMQAKIFRWYNLQNMKKLTALNHSVYCTSILWLLVLVIKKLSESLSHATSSKIVY